MTKRIICIFIAVLMVLTTFASCGKEKDISSGVNTGESETILSSDGNSNSSSDGTGDDVQTNQSSGDGSVNSNTNSSNNDGGTSNSKDKNTTTSNNNSTATSNNNQSSSSNNNSNNNNNSGNVTQLVIKNDNTLYKNYPQITNAYKSPGNNGTYFDKNSSGIYENKYVKVDATKAKQGYLLVTYKDPWAQRIDFALDETASHSGKYQKTHYYYYNQGDFSLNKPIALALPKTDAIYYLVVASVIEGWDSNKIEVNLGQITVDGYASYQDMVPTEEQIKMSLVSSGVYANKYVKINTNTANKGYLEVEYLDTKGYDIKVSMCSNKKNEYGNLASWKYQTNNKGKCTIKAALTYGNAEYTINVISTMKNDSTGVERISKKATLTINLTNVSSTGAFLLNGGEVEFNTSMSFIKKANEIASTCKDDFEKVSKIYDWLTQYIKYQVVEDTVVGQYKCDLNKIYNRKTGVCYDYAVVLAAMLRSQGIPCKVVFGKYANSAAGLGHAWNEVYIAKSGSITTNELSITGNKWCTLDPTLSNVNSSQSAIDFMNNDKNYTWELYY